MQPEKQVSTSVFFWGFLVKTEKEPLPKRIPELDKHSIQKVKAGGFFFLAINNKGDLFAWGTSKHHRSGFQSEEDVQIPRQVPIKIKVKNMAAGNWHSMIVDFEGNLYGTGHNKYGALGLKHLNNVNGFTKVELEPRIEEVAAGDGFSLVVSDKGGLYTSGHTDFHGHSSKDHLSQFKLIKVEENFVKVSAGFTHSLAVTQKGKVYSWGEGNCYQLGHGNKNNLKTPKLIEALQDVHIAEVSCTRGQKNAHSMAVDKEGKIYTWGAGYKGKLGHHTEWSHADQADEPLPKMIKSIEFPVEKPAAGGIHSCFLSREGDIYSFGCGSDGRLGHPESTDHRYLYREGIPRKIETLKEWQITNLQCSYYQNICVGSRRPK